MGRAAEPVYAAQGSASPSLPPKPLVQTLRIVVFQQLFCKRASKSMLLPKVGVGEDRAQQGLGGLLPPTFTAFALLMSPSS